MADEKLIFPIGFDLEEGVAKVEKDWGKMQKRLQDTFKSQTIQVDADISKAVLDKLYAKFEGLIKTMESKAPQIKLKMPDTVDFEQEINRLKVQLKSINLGELTDAESKDLYLYIRQLEALAKALKEVNKQEQLRQANNPANKALQEARAQEKLTRAKANDALAEQRRAKIATETARQNEINNRSAQRGAVIAEQKRAATARAEQAELRLTQAKKRSTQATHEQNVAYKTQSSYLQRLFQRMVAYASVAQAFSFIRNIREGTAEFELQRVALGALIQDTQKANMIFEQIKVQAVKSPYEVKDLVTYTKQLAAYGVKADDLIGTMNQLADISAGLGTDMNRIILAYGQIQAAGVLKGTELKQLTELGLPMVELLADYYSTLRNEVVTTSEVFDMISNKEIPFEAVQDILEDLTSEGGRFFDMQSKQAETLAGQWSNMKDTLSIMFDEIGRSEEVQALMRGLIDATKSLAENWRVIWQTVKVVGLTYAGLKSASVITRLLSTTTMTAEIAQKKYTRALRETVIAMGNNGRLATLMAKRSVLVAKMQLNAANATNILSRSFYKLGAVIMANPVGAIMTLVSVLGFFITKNKMAKATAETFAEEQSRLASDMAVNIESSIKNFRRLANEVVRFENGSANQQAALRKLKDQFGDMLPEYQLTAEYLSDISREANNSADAFNKLETSIRGQQTAELQLKLIEREQERIQEMYNEVYDMASGGGFQFVDAFGEMTRRVEDGEWFENIYNDWRDTFNDIYGDVDDLTKLFAANSNTYGYMMDYFYKKGTETYNWEDLRNLYNQGLLTWGQYQSFVKSLIGNEQYANISAMYDLLEAMGMYQENVGKIINDTENLDPAFSNVTKVVSKAQESFKKLEEIGGDSAKNIREAYDEQMLEIQKQALKGLYDEIESAPTAWAIEGYFNNLGISIETANVSLEQFLANVENDKLGDIELPDNFIYGLNELRKMFGYMDDDWRNYMAKQVGFVGNRTVTAFNTQQINSFSSLYDAIDQTSKAYEENTKALQKYRSLRANTNDKEAIDTYNKEIAVLEERTRQQEAFLTKYGWTGTDDALKKRQSLLKDELSTVEKIYKEYQSLRKYMSVSDAQATINQMFGNVPFKILGMATSFEEMREQLNKALKEAKRLGDTKLAMDIEYSIGKLDADEVKKNMEREIKAISEELSRTKEAKEFFDKMLGMTGDKQLSATLTMSVYGTTGDDLEKLMSQQIIDAFKNVDISEAMLGGNKWDYDVLAGFVSQLPEEQQKNAQSIVDNWRKANANILNDVVKSYEDFMTYEERKTRVVEKYAAERKRIMESQLPEVERDKYIKATNKREGKELADIAIEEFKASDDWIKSFEDLENLATPTIERLMMELKEFIALNKEALTPEQLKSLMGEYDKLYNGLIARNPFQAITDSIKEYKDAMQGVKLAEVSLDAAKAMGDEDLIAFAERQLTDAFDEMQKATSKLQKGLSGLGDKFSQAQQFVASFTDTLGISEDTEFGAFLNGISDALGGVSKALAFAQLGVQLFDGTIKKMLASNPIGWILLAVSAIISAVQAIANARIKRIDKDIERLEGRLDSLSYAYDRLQKAQEKAFGSEYISNYQRQLENLEAQQEAYLKQAEKERSKGKKADEAKIKDYEKQARDAADAIKDMYGSLSEKFLGTDLTSAARDFASAWIDAYKEFSNTTDAMKTKFQDMVQNMVVESLLAKVMEKALEPVFTMIDEMGEGDFYSPSFWRDVMASMQVASENGAIGAENIMSMIESMGINLRDTGASLTGISKDIATASAEKSILGLAAGINTQNFYISQVPTKLDTIIGLLRGDGAMPQGSAITLQDVMIAQNQYLSHLPTIAQHTAETVAECRAIVAETRRTADALDRVIKPKGTQTTYTMNTTLGS